MPEINIRIGEPRRQVRIDIWVGGEHVPLHRVPAPHAELPFARFLRGDAGPPGAAGPAGPAGPPGPPGSGGSGGSLQIVFSSPATSWIVNHNLNRAASIEAFTSGGVRMIADVQNISLNQSIVSFEDPQSGYVVIN